MLEVILGVPLSVAMPFTVVIFKFEFFFHLHFRFYFILFLVFLFFIYCSSEEKEENKKNKKAGSELCDEKLMKQRDKEKGLIKEMQKGQRKAGVKTQLVITV